jgi:hypothetical protein
VLIWNYKSGQKQKQEWAETKRHHNPLEWGEEMWTEKDYKNKFISCTYFPSSVAIFQHHQRTKFEFEQLAPLQSLHPTVQSKPHISYINYIC